ncbi:hypothetical protein D3C80_1712850 [compost metagenome]
MLFVGLEKRGDHGPRLQSGCVIGKPFSSKTVCLKLLLPLILQCFWIDEMLIAMEDRKIGHL